MSSESVKSKPYALTLGFVLQNDRAFWTLARWIFAPILLMGVIFVSGGILAQNWMLALLGVLITFAIPAFRIYLLYQSRTRKVPIALFEYELDTTGLQFSNDRGIERKYVWSSFTKAVESPTCFLLYLSSTSNVILPKPAFEDVQLPEITRYLQSHGLLN